MRITLYILMIVCGLTLTVKPNSAQSHFNQDYKLLASNQFEKKVNIQSNRSFFFLSDKKFFKYNPVSLAFGGLMYMYQNVIASQIAADCPYEISCSAFARQSIKKYGLIKGSALASDRLTRCTKLSGADLHPLDYTLQGKIIDDPLEYRVER